MNPLNTVGFFHCSGCENEWYDFDVDDEAIQDCLSCGYLVQAFLVTDKCFGYFKCKDCNRNWCSAHTFVRTYQKCKTCNVHVYADKMAPLEGGGIIGRPPHEASLCGKCAEMGGKCQSLRTWRRSLDYDSKKKKKNRRKKTEKTKVGEEISKEDKDKIKGQNKRTKKTKKAKTLTNETKENTNLIKRFENLKI